MKEDSQKVGSKDNIDISPTGYGYVQENRAAQKENKKIRREK